MSQNEIKKNSQRRTALFFLRIVGQFLLFLVMLLAIGFLLHMKINDSLDREVSKFCAQQGRLAGSIYHNIFQEELNLLEEESRFLASGNMLTPENLASLSSDVNIGLMDMSGQVLHGPALPEESALQRMKALQGYSTMNFYKDLGLAAMVPVYDGHNVRYVLYRLHTIKELASPSYLHISDKQAKEDILLFDMDTQQVVIPFDGYGPGNHFYNESSGTPRGLDELLADLDASQDAAIFTRDVDDDHIIFASRVPDTGFVALGYVDGEAVIKGIRNIHLIVLWVFGLLVVLFCVFILYSFVNQTAAEEGKELREARDDALRANQAKSDFLANMSHEIRTPLNAILGMNEMIMREAKGNLKKYSFNIKNAGEALLSIINDVLDFSKIESGKMEIVSVSYSLSSMLNDIYTMINYRAKEKNLEFNIHVDPEIPDALIGDEVRLRQVLVNILTNAVKYTPKGSVDFTVRAEYDSTAHDLMTLTFICRDTGLGIKEEDKKRLFSKFQRLDMKKNRNIEGTGLGLAITTSLVQMMKGTIGMESTYGEGSTFTIRLPQRIERDEAIGDFRQRVQNLMDMQEAYHESFTAPDGNILVVDDVEMNLVVVQSLLEKTKLHIDTALNGKEALEKIKENRYDIIFLDHMMPEMDGIETLHQAKEMKSSKNKKTPFVALTANAVSGVRDMFISKGFDDYLAKPVDGKTLEQMVQKYMPREKIYAVEDFPEEEPATAPVATYEADASYPPEVSPHEYGEAPEEDHQPHPGSGEEAPFGEAAGTGEAAGEAPPAQEDAPPADEGNYQIDVPTAMKYCGGMEAMQVKFLSMFVSRRESVVAQLLKDLEEDNIPDYTTHIHAVKSTSLSVGGLKLSETAKALEMAGHAYQDGNEEEKEMNLSYIKEYNGYAIELYEKLAQEAKERFGVDEG